MANSENLKKVIDQKIEDLANMEPGTEEHSRLANDVAKLTQVIQEEDKQQLEIEKMELQDNNRDRDVKREWIQFALTTAIGVATTAGTMVFWKHRYHEGLNFEQTGTYTARGGAQNVMKHFPKIGK